MSRPIRVAAAQLDGGLFAPQKAVERACEAIAQAGAQDIGLLVFPECYVGGYPYWQGQVSVRAETELAARLYEASVRVDGEEVEAVARASMEHGVAVVLGVAEQDDRPGSCTGYNSLLFFDPDHGYVARHRKLVPTHTERAYWGRGRAEDLVVHPFRFAQVGALICYEHHMLPARMALALMGEEIHCAAWPGYWETGDHIADKHPGPATRHAEIDAVVRDYALGTQTFVVSANAYLDVGGVPSDVRDLLGGNFARGGSAVVDPNGRYLAGPVFDEQTLVTAAIDLTDRHVTKSYLDTAGHYARWDIFRFGLHPSPAPPDLSPPARTNGEDTSDLPHPSGQGPTGRPMGDPAAGNDPATKGVRRET